MTHANTARGDQETLNTEADMVTGSVSDIKSDECYFPPVIVTGVTADASIMQEEVRPDAASCPPLLYFRFVHLNSFPCLPCYIFVSFT